jgi:uncharacterized membrane protein YeaQ/YmgE (transglycosylase-associated protein family)
MQILAAIMFTAIAGTVVGAVIVEQTRSGKLLKIRKKRNG